MRSPTAFPFRSSMEVPVARLDDVVGAILRDLTLAQDVASKHTRMLAVEYASDPLLRYFPIPRTELSDVDIELRFAPKQLKKVAGSPERTMAFAKVAFDRYAVAASKALLAIASDRLERAKSMPSFTAAMQEQVRQGLLAPEFEEYVRKAISGDLFDARAKLVTPPDSVDLDGVRDTTIETAARVVFEHQDLKTFIEANPKFTADTLDQIKDALKAPLDALARDFSSSDLRADEYELDVSMDADEIADLSASSLAVVRIKAAMQNYKWVTSPGVADQLVEER